MKPFGDVKTPLRYTGSPIKRTPVSTHTLDQENEEM
jgi:hypothetical protein